MFSRQMANFINETRLRVVRSFVFKSHTVIATPQSLNYENIEISCQALIIKYQSGMLSLVRPWHLKVTEDMKALIERTLRNNDEVTCTGLRSQNISNIASCKLLNDAVNKFMRTS